MTEPSALATGPRLHFGVVILAAGASSRMGTPKQLLPVNGRAMVVRAAEAALATRAAPVVVVLGANADKVRSALATLPILITENPDWPAGMASSIRAGMAALGSASPLLDAVVMALCDQPAFSSHVIARLLSAQRASGRNIVAARYAGRNGAPALFCRSQFGRLAALEGDRGARTLLNGDPESVESVELSQLAIDLDSPADYETFLKGRVG